MRRKRPSRWPVVFRLVSLGALVAFALWLVGVEQKMLLPGLPHFALAALMFVTAKAVGGPLLRRWRHTGGAYRNGSDWPAFMLVALVASALSSYLCGLGFYVPPGPIAWSAYMASVLIDR